MTDDQDLKRQREATLAWMQSNWTQSKACPICGHSEWNLTDLMEIRAFSNGDLNLTAPIFPVVHAVCETCGFFHSFSAVIAGLTGSPQVNADSGELI